MSLLVTHTSDGVFASMVGIHELKLVKLGVTSALAFTPTSLKLQPGKVG